MDIEEAIFGITQNVWESILGLEIRRAQTVGSLSGAVRGQTMTGCVQLAGAWEGSVFLYCSVALAKSVAATMFGTDSERLNEGDVEDALGELTNMIAGNLKTVLPRPCTLSLPAVVEGLDYRVIVPGTKISGQVLFEFNSEPLLVTLLEGSTMSSRRSAMGEPERAQQGT